MEIGEFFHANRACPACIQFFAAFAHPVDLLGWIAYHKRVVRDILCDYRPGADEGIAADGMAADNGAVGSQGSALLDEGRTNLVHLGDFRPGVVDVGENHRGAAEDAVFEGDAFIDADVILDFAFVADGHIGADDNVLADVAVFTDFGAGKDVGEVPDLCFFANFYTHIYHCRWMGEKTHVRS